MQGKKVSKPILRIAVISISLSIVVNLITLAIVTGFQNEIREKVIGFSAPLFLQNINNANVYESDPIRISRNVEKQLKSLSAECTFDRVAYKPGMLQSSGKNNQPKEVLGLVFKGIDATYNTEFLKSHLVAGKIPVYNGGKPSQNIVISQRISEQLHLKVNDEVTAFFVRNQPITRKLTVTGIYHTGYEDYDSKMVICDLKLNQNLNDWGLEGQLELADSLYGGQPILGFTVNGQKQEVYFDWGKGPQLESATLINPLKDSVFQTSLMVRGTSGNLEKARRYFLIAQLKSKSGQKETANKFYDKSIAITTDPVMEAYARIYQVALSANEEDLEKRTNEQVEMLLRMAKREKYLSYQSIIYNAAAEMEMGRNKSEAAIDLLLKSNAANSNDQAGRSFNNLKIATLAFKGKNYKLAKTYYDSLGLIPKEMEKEVDIKKKVSNELVALLDVIEKEDSLEMVAKMPAQASATLVGLINIGLTFKKQWSLACSPASTEPS